MDFCEHLEIVRGVVELGRKDFNFEVQLGRAVDGNSELGSPELGAEVDDTMKDVGASGRADVAEECGIAMREMDATSGMGTKVQGIVGLLKKVRAYNLSDIVRDCLGNPASHGGGGEVEVLAKRLDCEPPWRRVEPRN